MPSGIAIDRKSAAGRFSFLGRPRRTVGQTALKKKNRVSAVKYRSGGAQRETRTPTPIGTATSRQRVYQFHHLGTGSLLLKTAALGKHFFGLFRIFCRASVKPLFRALRSMAASFFPFDKAMQNAYCFFTRNRAAAAPPTPPGPKGSNGNGCCRVSGSSKGAMSVAPFPFKSRLPPLFSGHLHGMGFCAKKDGGSFFQHFVRYSPSGARPREYDHA